MYHKNCEAIHWFKLLFLSRNQNFSIFFRSNRGHNSCQNWHITSLFPTQSVCYWWSLCHIYFKETHPLNLSYWVETKYFSFFRSIQSHNSCPNWCISSIFQLNLYFVDGQVPHRKKKSMNLHLVVGQKPKICSISRLWRTIIPVQIEK